MIDHARHLTDGTPRWIRVHCLDGHAMTVDQLGDRVAICRRCGSGECPDPTWAMAGTEGVRTWLRCAGCGFERDVVAWCPCGAYGDEQSVGEHIDSRACPEGGAIT